MFPCFFWSLTYISLFVSLFCVATSLGRQVPAFEGLLLFESSNTVTRQEPGGAPTHFHVCRDCSKSLMSGGKTKNPPKHSVANDLYLGEFPPELQAGEVNFASMIVHCWTLSKKREKGRKIRNSYFWQCPFFGMSFFRNLFLASVLYSFI